MQLLPLAGLLVARVAPGRVGVVAVWCAAGCYAALTAAILAQALAGRPLV